MRTNIKFAKVRTDAKIPSKRDEDMGFDIYACFDEDYIVIEPHETKLVPTGIASACDADYGFLVFERGSTGSKGIARRCGVIDSGYRNEWFIGLTNTTKNTLFITKLSEEETINRFIEDWATKINNAGNKVTEDVLRVETEYLIANNIMYPYSKAIAQALVIPVPKTKVGELSYKELQNIKSERGLGALGSSGK